MSIYTVTTEARAVTDQVNNRINLEFRNAELAAYFEARILSVVSSFNANDSVVATFIGTDNLGQSVTWDHDSEWNSTNFVRTGAIITVHNGGNEVHTAGLTNFFRFTELRLASGPANSLPTTHGTFTAATRVDLDTDSGDLTFDDATNAEGFATAINRLAYRYDRLLSYTFRLQDQSSNADVSLFPGFRLATPGLPIVIQANNVVRLAISGDDINTINGLVDDQERNLTNFRIFDENGEELYLGTPRYDPSSATGVSPWNRPRSRRQTVADRRGDTSWAGNTSMRNPQANPLTRIPYVNPFRDGEG